MKTTSLLVSSTDGAILFWRVFTLWVLRLCPVFLLSGLIAGCDTIQPEDPDTEATPLEDTTPVLEGYDTRFDLVGASKTADRAHWADGYVWADQPTSRILHGRIAGKSSETAYCVLSGLLHSRNTHRCYSGEYFVVQEAIRCDDPSVPFET